MKTKTLSDLIQKLEELDDEDFFGTEGWRKFLLGDSESVITEEIK